MNKQEQIILADSEDAAKLMTVTGLVSRDGFYYGKNEDSARYAGCTHRKCECGEITPKHYTHCETCRAQRQYERYQTLPFKKWEGEPLVLYCDDTYFFDEDALLDYCDSNEIEPQDLQLMICKPKYIWEVDYNDLYCDYLPEDQGLEDVAPEIAAAFDNLNALIKQRKQPLSWSEGKFRTSYERKNSEAA